jgi:heat shock protein HslJ
MRYGFALLVLAGLALAACASASPNALVGDWELVSYGLPSSLQPAASVVDTLIQFNSDGTLSGNVGCNGFGGDYRVEGTEIEFSQIIATLIFCEGPVGEQESFTLRVFADTSSFVLDGDTLTITSTDSASALVLARK